MGVLYRRVNSAISVRASAVLSELRLIQMSGVTIFLAANRRRRSPSSRSTCETLDDGVVEESNFCNVSR